MKDSYILTLDKLAGAKEDLSILHPLPRVNEISSPALMTGTRECMEATRGAPSLGWRMAMMSL